MRSRGEECRRGKRSIGEIENRRRGGGDGEVGGTGDR